MISEIPENYDDLLSKLLYASRGMPNYAIATNFPKPWTASIDEGWTLFVLYNFEFTYTSVLRISVDQEHLVGYGCPQLVSRYFARSQAFELVEESRKEEKDLRSPNVRFPARVVARYSDTVLLESGWIRGVELIADKPVIVEVQYDKGIIILLGFLIQYPGQSHGTFHLRFNTILSNMKVDTGTI